MTVRTYRIPAHAAGERLDVALAALDPELSRSHVATLIRDGRVVVTNPDGSPPKKIKTGLRITGGETVEVDLPDTEPFSAAPEDIPLDIRYEDDDLLVINKPAGMVVHPAPGHAGGTLVNALAAYSDRLSNVGGPFRPGIIHRLDKDTSGLLIVAKHDTAHRKLAAQLADRTLSREYVALVWGHLSPPDGRIDEPIGRGRQGGKLMAIGGRASRDAVTRYATVEQYAFTSWVRVRLETGRTHQIRVHMHHVGHPVVGDDDYGGRVAIRGIAPVYRRDAEKVLAAIDRQMLHAARLVFLHPTTAESVSVEASPPEDIEYARRLAAGF